MGIWYEKFKRYREKVEKTTEDIEDQKYYSDLPGPLSMKYIHTCMSSKGEKCYVYDGPEKLKDFLHKLQFFAHFNSHPTDTKGEHEITWVIFGQPITFYLFENHVPSAYKITGKTSVRGKQILFKVNDQGKRKMTEYSDIMPELEAYSSTELGHAMLNALNSSQFDQTSEGLSESIIRPASIFLLLTHIPEAAIPFKETLKEFDTAVFYNTQISTEPNDKIVDIKKKTGRVPMADKIARGKLRDVASGKVTFKGAFSLENYPIRKKGGTNEGRQWVLKDVEGVSTGDLSDSEDESNTLSEFLIESKYQEFRNQVFLPES